MFVHTDFLRKDILQNLKTPIRTPSKMKQKNIQMKF